MLKFPAQTYATEAERDLELPVEELLFYQKH